MVKFFGRHSSKQYIKGKPVRCGYKNWMLCSSSGYCYAFDTYCGANNYSQSAGATDWPLGSKVVLDLLKSIAIPSDHVVFFDNYFSSHALLKTLKNQGQRATGTVRDNRTRKCPLSSVELFKKKKRGYFEHMYDRDSGLLFIRWQDNNTVTMVTNYDTLEPVYHVKRWSAIDKEKIDIQQPSIFQNYNRFMGGVDLHDQAVNNYRISIRSKKWWWMLFTNMINMTVVNAWRLFQVANNESMGLLEFERMIVRHYLSCHNKSTYTKLRPIGQLPISVRMEGAGHFPQKLDKQLRCTQCHLRARWSCSRCKVTLCIERDYFRSYHS